MVRWLAPIALVLLLASCGEEPKPETVFEIQGTYDKIQMANIEKTINVFRKACPNLFDKYWSDVTEAKATVWPHFMKAVYGEVTMPFLDQYGWRYSLFLEITISENPQKIPYSYNANGHTLFYHLGGGRRPGISSAKVQSQRVCGFKEDADRDVFTSVPGLSVMSAFD